MQQKSDLERQHRRAEAALGFPLLRGCPNDFAVRLLAGLDALTDAERLDFADQLSDLAEAQTGQALSSDARAGFLRERPLAERFYGQRDPVAAPLQLRFMPVKRLAAILRDLGGIDGVARTFALTEQHLALPGPHVTGLAEVEPVAPARLRKAVKAAVLARFGGSATKQSAEAERIVAAVPQGRMTLDMVFAASGRPDAKQMEYHFFVDIAGEAGRFAPTTYETLWLLPAWWNMLTEANLDRSMDHLLRVIEARLALI